VIYLEKYVEILKQNQLKITPQRLAVMKYLDENRTHPTADRIYTDLKEKNPSLSKTTVYNSLDTLQNHNIIQSITISPSELRYDFKKSMHHHFLCKRCGDIIDIELECPNIKKTIDQGHKVEEVHGYFKGICKKCIEKQEN
jgi:Fe2+ or Zn2+ uptake regulation protein